MGTPNPLLLRNVLAFLRTREGALTAALVLCIGVIALLAAYIYVRGWH